MILGTFLAGLVVVLTAFVYACIRGVELWRQAKRSGRVFATELARFEERAVRAERLLAEFELSSKELAVAQERLRISTARLQVLTASLEAAQRRTAWLRAFLPLR